MNKLEFVEKLFEFLKKISFNGQKRVLADMTRVNNSILCDEHKEIFDINKEKPISRFGKPIREWLIDKLSKTKYKHIKDNINWKITKGKNKDFKEVRKALKHLLNIAALHYIETNDKEFLKYFFKTLNSTQHCLIKSTAPMLYKSNTAGKKLNVGKRNAKSKIKQDPGFTKEHIIPTKFICESLKKAVFSNKVDVDFDLIMKDNFQVLLNSDDDELVNIAGLKSKMPDGWMFGDSPFLRYIEAGVNINDIKKI